MGEYAGLSHPRLPHSYCMSAEISNSGTFGFTAFIAAACAATEASTALRSRTISPASLLVRSESSVGLDVLKNQKGIRSAKKGERLRAG